MKDSYTKEKGVFHSYEMPDGFYPIATAEKTIFHVGQSYATGPVPTFICKECGTDKFNVGTSNYVTAIRCPSCGWEKVIHDG